MLNRLVAFETLTCHGKPGCRPVIPLCLMMIFLENFSFPEGEGDVAWDGALPRSLSLPK